MQDWIRVDCDYLAQGLWDQRGRMVELAAVPISQPLRERILAWQAWFDEACAPWETGNAYDWGLHELTAIDIAKCIKRELPKWTVVALRQEVNGDGPLGRVVPYPGETVGPKRPA